MPASRGNTSVTNFSQNSNISRRQEVRSQICREEIRTKLGYDWKAIFKNLARHDNSNSGVVTRETFEQVCDQAGAKLAKEDVSRVMNLFSDSSQMIDYNRMSRDLNLHRDGLDIFSNTRQRQT